MNIELIKKDIEEYGLSQFYANNSLLVSVVEDECGYSVSFVKGSSTRNVQKIAEFYNINETVLAELMKLVNFRKEG